MLANASAILFASNIFSIPALAEQASHDTTTSTATKILLADSTRKQQPAQKLITPSPPLFDMLPAAATAGKKKQSLKILEAVPDTANSDQVPTDPELGRQAQEGTEKASKVAPYILGPGDQLTVVDPSLGTDEAPYEKDVELAPDGTLSVYPVGILQAEGLTLGELTELINNKQRSFVNQPQVVVMLKKARPVHVHVLGEVVSPGLYSSLSLGNTPSTTVGNNNTNNSPTPLQDLNQNSNSGLRLSTGVTLSATDKAPRVGDLTVLTAIQIAGGVTDTADIRNIKLSRAGETETRTIDLERMLVEGDYMQDIPLRSGDNIFVPKGGAAFLASKLGAAVRTPRPVRIIGEVNRPGLYYLGPNDDLITILAKAGGFDVIAKQRNIVLSRLNHDGTVTTRTVDVKAALRNADKVGRLEVMPGDVVVVSASMIRKVGPTIGYVAPIAGMFTILSVISAALPVTFMRNASRGNTGQNVGNAFFGIGLSNGLLFGSGARQNTAPAGIP